jgi:hypothetical protein
MNCFEAQDKIINLVLGELASDDEILLKEHLHSCPLCNQDLQFLNECLDVCMHNEGETCECQFQETYWNDFIVTVHEKIRHEKVAKKFPMHIVLPIAASALAAVIIGYFFFLKPAPQETVQDTTPDYQYNDAYDEVYELSPEETEEFIKMINQRYGSE